MSQLKKYYKILGVNYDASTFAIKKAYQALAAQWPLDKHKTDRALAEKKFHEISEASEVLENSNKRKHYDDMLRLEFSLEDANRTFDDVFGNMESSMKKRRSSSMSIIPNGPRTTTKPLEFQETHQWMR